MAKPKTPDYRYTPEVEQHLLNDMLSPELANDPEAFAQYAFPWGKKGTPLEGIAGPRGWQREIMEEIAHHCRKNEGAIAKALEATGLRDGPRLYQSATASGRGVGKSALISMLTLWHLSTHLGSSTIVTANSESQLRDRTFAELAQWLTLAINRHWFEQSALAIEPAPWFADAIRRDLHVDSTYYSVRGQLWSAERPDAFAGVHNPRGLMVCFDEASGIPSSIFEISRGFFTEPTRHRYWLTFGNPRNNTGPFYDSFTTGQREEWHARQIDARTVEGTDPELYASFVRKYGIDSDTVKVEVLGQFPGFAVDSFIARAVIEQAATRQIDHDPHAPLILGVDVARFGSDSTVLRYRQGRNARVLPPIKLRGFDNMQVANRIAQEIDFRRPDAVCIDGAAAGVIDRLRERNYKVHAVDFGGKAQSDEYANIRTEIWARLRDWLPEGAIDADPLLIEDMAAPTYKYQIGTDRILLERKDELKRRGFRSPDDGDALACTFAVRVARRDNPSGRSNRRQYADGIGTGPFDSDAPAPNPRYSNSATMRRDMFGAKSARKRFADMDD